MKAITGQPLKINLPVTIGIGRFPEGINVDIRMQYPDVLSISL